jgi:hypothetical protein
MAWTLSIALLVSNLGALVALWMGLRAQAPEKVRALGVRAMILTGIALVVALFGLIFSLSGGFGAASTADAAERAAVLARSISEGLNLFAFGMIACILPAVATVVLFVRHGRLRRAP